MQPVVQQAGTKHKQAQAHQTSSCQACSMFVVQVPINSLRANFGKQGEPCTWLQP